jgi:hypothetical protein
MSSIIPGQDARRTALKWFAGIALAAILVAFRFAPNTLSFFLMLTLETVLAVIVWLLYSFRSTWLTFAAGIFLILLFGFLNLYLRDVAGSADTYESVRAQKRLETRLQIDRDAQTLLNSADWIDKNKGIVRIPIANAIEQEIAALNNKKPHPAYAIVVAPAVPTTPAAAAAPAAGQTPTPGASPAPAAAVTPAAGKTPAPGASPAPVPAATANPPAPAPAGSAGASPPPGGGKSKPNLSRPTLP